MTLTGKGSAAFSVIWLKSTSNDDLVKVRDVERRFLLCGNARINGDFSVFQKRPPRRDFATCKKVHFSMLKKSVNTRLSPEPPRSVREVPPSSQGEEKN
jgi:hypothetical protein